MKIPRKNSSGTGTAQRETPVQYPARLVYECQGNRRKDRGMMGWLRKPVRTILLRALLCRWTVF